jgi:hypothetical protein
MGVTTMCFSNGNAANQTLLPAAKPTASREKRSGSESVTAKAATFVSAADVGLPASIGMVTDGPAILLAAASATALPNDPR